MCPPGVVYDGAGAAVMVRQGGASVAAGAERAQLGHYVHTNAGLKNEFGQKKKKTLPFIDDTVVFVLMNVTTDHAHWTKPGVDVDGPASSKPPT